MRVACIQMNSGCDAGCNLERAAALLGLAASRGAKLALLPENFAFMDRNEDSRRRLAEPESSSRLIAFLREQAARLGLAIIGGSIPLASDREGRVRNACPVVDAGGNLVAVYDKMHLFDVDLGEEQYRESDSTVPGAAPVSVEIEGWRIGLSICYDLRFPELYRRYADQDCDAFAVPAAFTVPTGRAHWSVLLRARAIENQAYVLAAAQWGAHPGGRTTWGHSMIVDPWGDVLDECAEGEGIACAVMQRAQIRELRARMPVLSHRRIQERGE